MNLGGSGDCLVPVPRHFEVPPKSESAIAGCVDRTQKLHLGAQPSEGERDWWDSGERKTPGTRAIRGEKAARGGVSATGTRIPHRHLVLRAAMDPTIVGSDLARCLLSTA